MSVTADTTRSQECLKRMLDEPQDGTSKRKRCLTPPPPSTGHSPWLKPRNHASKSLRNAPPRQVGAYLLLEHSEKDDAYRAVHEDGRQQHTCQVLPLQGHQETLAGYSRIGKHSNVCSLLDVVPRQDGVYAFLPRHHGDMHAYVRNRKHLDEEEARRFFIQMVSAVAHCHGQGVVLRDLKLRRFVFTDKHRTHLALLGLSDCVVLYGDHDDDSLVDRHGCPAYVGPELLCSGHRSYSGRAADVWSLGVSLYTMLVGRYPFQDTQPAALFAKIRRGAYSLPGWLSPQAKCLIGCMLRKEPSERLTASELLMHPWLTEPCTPHPSVHKTFHSRGTTAADTQDSHEQVVPTWTEERQQENPADSLSGVLQAGTHSS
ncbi:Tribbles-like protein 2 [Oryzias melastigma]|uniref:Tribbles-like protein 2 n=1 Tax=Oryzias melastigma TaxID=30732 RepID=A0A834BW78_ORYME|nr:Tribbles-like protein 2 [Oryzias melastigma]